MPLFHMPRRMTSKTRELTLTNLRSFRFKAEPLPRSFFVRGQLSLMISHIDVEV